MAETEAEVMDKHAGRDHYYNPAKNPDGAWIGGVPLRDLSGEEWDALPAAQRRDALHHGWWRLTPVPRASSESEVESEPGPSEAEVPARRPRPVRVTVEPEPDTAGSNAVPSPVLDPAPPNEVMGEGGSQ